MRLWVSVNLVILAGTGLLLQWVLQSRLYRDLPCLYVSLQGCSVKYTSRRSEDKKIRGSLQNELKRLFVEKAA